MKPIRTMTVFGTRPEVIKMAPVLAQLKKSPHFQTITVATGQHRELQAQALDIFKIKPDYNLDLMVPEESINELAADMLRALDRIIVREKPDLILVQGDTTTAFIGCLAAFYKKKTIGHIEAGLRSHDKFHPFPEEINRKLISQLADVHFAPTAAEAEILRGEHVDPQTVFVTGNTVIDALFQIIQDGYTFHNSELRKINSGCRLLVVTSHRRENFGRPLHEICNAISRLVDLHSDVEIVFSVHRNPHVRIPVTRRLSSCKRVHLVKPLDYADMANLMARSLLILTDSGGLQEEAPALGKPLLVLRDVTERPEVLENGLGKLVGTSSSAIVSRVNELMSNTFSYRSMARGLSPYGDGQAAARIVAALEFMFKIRASRPLAFHMEPVPLRPAAKLKTGYAKAA